jgi:hypothetical protein
MAKRKYPIKKFTLNVKMRCDYYPDTHKRCTNVAKIINISKSDEGKRVYTYCEECFKDYKLGEKERRRINVD